MQRSGLTNGNGAVVPAPPPFEVSSCQNGAHRQGFATPLTRPCLLRAVPAIEPIAKGGSDGNNSEAGGMTTDRTTNGEQLTQKY